jgi:hypothetical protein
VVEILPALLSDVYNGSITGLRARCNTQVDINWDINAWKASVTLNSDTDKNNVKVRCGLGWAQASVNGVKQSILTDNDGMPYVDLVLSKGVPVTVDFTLDDSAKLVADIDVDVMKTVDVGTTVNVSARDAFTRNKVETAVWHVEKADGTAAGAVGSDGTYTIDAAYAGQFIKLYATSGSMKSNDIILHVAGGTAMTVNVKKDGEGAGVYIANDGTAKNVEVIYAAYDASGKLAGMNAKDVSLGAGDYKIVKLQQNWTAGNYTTYAYVWDKATQSPYTDKMIVK